MIITSLIYVLICCFVSLTFFENRMTSETITARADSKGEVLFIFNKIIL
jgi:hypothetical protein